MNTQVTATNMQVKAVADKGLLINETAAASATTWDSEATAAQSTAVLLRATSTADTKTWYTAVSSKASTAASAAQNAKSSDLVGEYTTLTTTAENTAAVAGTNAERNIYYVDDNLSSSYDDGEAYYVKYTYYIKSSAEAVTCALTQGSQNLNIKSVTANPATSTSVNLDKALRVAVVIAGKAYIYAPLYVSGTDTAPSCYVAAGNTLTTALFGSVAQATSLTTIPARDASGEQVDVYIYFEGEDANLKTDNVTSTLDNITIQVAFEIVTNAVAATDNGVVISTT